MAKKKAKKRRSKLQKPTTYGEFLILLPCCTDKHSEELYQILAEAERPEYVFGKEVPQTLNTITYGQLDDLSRIAKDEDPAVKLFGVLMNLTPAQVYKLNVFDVFGFANFCRRELSRINKLFEALAPTHTTEEIAAGVKDLNFGTFGVIDWYARRMGITNQDEVYSVAWVRIYTCMKNDYEQSEYEKRLNKQYIDKSKRKR